MRLVLQPPSDALLQPGGTFGLLLDFRAAHGAVLAAPAAAAAAAGSGSSLQPVCLQVRPVGARTALLCCVCAVWSANTQRCVGVPARCKRVSLPAAARCPVQVVALLESEEVVLPPYAPARASTGITAMRKLYAEQQEVTAHLLTTHFTFSIPLTAPPSFKTPMVCHKWLLRFELTLGKPKPNRPAELTTEQLLWSLPLVVYPPLSPVAAGQMI